MTRPDAGLRTALLVGLLVLATVAAGCSTLTGGDGGLPAPEQVDSKLDSLHAVKATMVSSTNVTGGGTAARIEMVTRPRTGEFRAVVREGDGREGTLLVSNGTTLYMYNRTDNRVQVVDVGGLSSLRNGSMDAIRSIFEQLHADSGEAETPSSISSLPVVPMGAGAGGASVSSLPLFGNVTYTYEGTGTVGGREAYVVAAVPQSEEPILSNYTIWLDAEWYYPLKQTGQLSLDGTNGSVTMTYRNVSFNPEIPAGTFEFEPPENATVVDSSNRSFESFESREALAAATNRSLPDPDVPPGYTFESGSRTTNPAGEQFSVRYAKGETSLTVLVQPPSTDTDSSTGDSITVDGQAATVTSLGESQVVDLSCENAAYSVIGSESQDVLVDVAASLDCA